MTNGKLNLDKYISLKPSEWADVPNTKAWRVMDALVQEIMAYEEKLKRLEKCFDLLKKRAEPLFDENETNVLQFGDTLLAQGSRESVAYKKVLDLLVALKPELADLVKRLSAQETSSSTFMRKATIDNKPSGFPTPKEGAEIVKIRMGKGE